MPFSFSRAAAAAVAALALAAAPCAAAPDAAAAEAAPTGPSMACCYTLETQSGKVEHVLRGNDQGCPSAETVHCEEMASRPSAPKKKKKGGPPESAEERAKRLASPAAVVYVGHLTPLMCEQISVATNAVGKWPLDEGKPHPCVGVHADASLSKTLAGVSCSALDAKPRDPVARSRDAKGCVERGGPAAPSAEDAVAVQGVVSAKQQPAAVPSNVLNPPK